MPTGSENSKEQRMEESLLRVELTERLHAIQSYENVSVLTNFQKKNSEHDLPACQQLMSDLCAWLVLKEWRDAQGKKTWLFGPLLALDELWHVFIIHTQDYHKFCEHYFGYYVHHTVEPVGAEHVMTPDELADFLDDALESLGTDWVLRYFRL